MNGNKRIQKKRAILLTENEEPLFRYDVNINGRNFIEFDMMNALTDMDKAGFIDLEKLFNMLKVKYGVSLEDTIDSLVGYNPYKEEMKETKNNEFSVYAKQREEEL